MERDVPENPWAWRGRNPYLATAFQVLNIDPGADRQTIRDAASIRRRRIASRPERFPLFGQTLSVTDINEAEEQLKTPRTRLLSELLTHQPDDHGAGLASVSGLLGLFELAESIDLTDRPEERDAARPNLGVTQDPQALLDDQVILALLPDPRTKTLEPLWVDGEAAQLPAGGPT